jgi:hypothetical protein
MVEFAGLPADRRDFYIVAHALFTNCFGRHCGTGSFHRCG